MTKAQATQQANEIISEYNESKDSRNTIELGTVFYGFFESPSVAGGHGAWMQIRQAYAQDMYFYGKSYAEALSELKMWALENSIA